MLVNLLKVWLFLCLGALSAQSTPDRSFPINVSLAAKIVDIKIIEAQDEYRATIILRTAWLDPTLAFDKIAAGRDKLNFIGPEARRKLSEIWYPQFTINNLKKIRSKHQGLIIHANGQIEHIFTLNGIFHTTVNLELFPFDQQNLPLILTSHYDKSIVHLQFQEEERNLSGVATKPPLWLFKELRGEVTQELGWNMELFPQMVFLFTFQRHAASYIPLIFFPFIIVMLFPMLSLCSNQIPVINKLSIMLSSILALITLQFTLTLSFHIKPSPESTIVQMFQWGYIYQVLIFLIIFLIEEVHYWRTNINTKFIVRDLINYLRWTIPLSFVILFIAVVLTSIN